MSLTISPQVVSITGTANQITASSPNGAVTLSTPQDIATASTPQFGGLGLGVALPATTIFQLNTATATNKGMVLKTTDNDTTKNLLEYQSSTGSAVGGFSADGRLGVGVGPASAYSQYVKKFITDQGWTGQGIEMWHRLTASSSSYILKGMYFQSLHLSDDTTYVGNNTAVAGIYALQGTAGLAGTKNLTGARSGDFYITVAGAGVLTNGWALYLNQPLVSGGGSITNVYGLYIHNQTVGTSLNYSIYTNSGVVRFGDKLGIITAAAPTNDLSFGGNAARTIWLERHTTSNTAGNTLTVQAGGATSGATNKAGGDLLLYPGTSTGSGTSKTIIYAFPGTAGSTSDNTAIAVLSAASGAVTLADPYDIVLGTTTGTKIGTGTTQKIGFYNATPIVQSANTTDLGVVLSDLGLRAAGTAYPITTSGAVTFTGAVAMNATTLATDTTTGLKIGTATTQKLGFFNATPIVRGTAFTQTYSTAAHTITQTTMTDPATYGAGANGYSTAAQASAIHAEVIALKANMVVTQNVLNGLIDDLQALGLIG